MCSWWWTMSNNPPVESVEAKEVRSLSNFGARANPDPVVTSPRSKFQQRESPALCEWEKRLRNGIGKTPQKLHQTASNIQISHQKKLKSPMKLADCFVSTRFSFLSSSWFFTTCRCLGWKFRVLHAQSGISVSYSRTPGRILSSAWPVPPNNKVLKNNPKMWSWWGV